MNRLCLFCFFLFFLGSVSAQTTAYTYTIKADSVKITNCDSAELIIENHTQGVPGFLYNTGNGRTIFKRAVTTGSDGSVIIGADTLKAWLQGGNRWGKAGVFGTLDSNDINIYTNNLHRAKVSAAGIFSTDSDAVIHGLTIGQGKGPQSIHTVLGVNALTQPITIGNGYGSVAIGNQAGALSKVNLIAIGDRAGYNSQGMSMYIGAEAGMNATSNGTIAIGDGAGMYAAGGYNVELGSGIMNSQGQTGWFNVVMGHLAAPKMTTGASNTLIGHYTGDSLTTGVGNTVVGALSGGGLITGSYNTLIGANLNGLPTDLSNAIILADGVGNKRIYTNAVGDVGIGTTTPSSLFQVTRPTYVGTGYADVGAGSTTVNGYGSEFTNLFKVGDSITITTTYPDTTSETHVILAINSNTSMTTSPWTAFQRGLYTVTSKNILSVKGYGNVGISTELPTSKMDISGDNGYSQLRLRSSYTPTSSSDTNGNTGDFSWDGNYFYIKTPTGWKRSALTTF